MKGEMEVICAAPVCNSFYQKGYIKNHVPIFYRIKLLPWLSISKNSNYKIKINEYTRENWTYHAKGLFMSNKNSKSIFFF